MRSREQLLPLAVFGLMVCAQFVVLASGRTNPYRAITERNVFGLRSPPPPPKPKPPPAPKLFLTGITTMLGTKEVFLKAQLPQKPGRPAKMESFALAEGQRRGDIQVLRIDAKARKVEVNDSGTHLVLTFDKNGVPASPGVRTPFRAVRPRWPSVAGRRYTPPLRRNLGWPALRR